MITSNQITWGNLYWHLWMAVATVSLLGPEIYALATNTMNTLSNIIWTDLKVDPGQTWTAGHYLVFGAWLNVMTWLTWHFFFRRFT